MGGVGLFPWDCATKVSAIPFQRGVECETDVTAQDVVFAIFP